MRGTGITVQLIPLSLLVVHLFPAGRACRTEDPARQNTTPVTGRMYGRSSTGEGMEHE